MKSFNTSRKGYAKEEANEFVKEEIGRAHV